MRGGPDWRDPLRLLPLWLYTHLLGVGAEIAVLESCRAAQDQLHEYITTSPAELFGPSNACFDSSRTVDASAAEQRL